MPGLQLHYVLIAAQFLAAGFLAITFIQSGLDKAMNYKANLEWMSGQFKNTFLAGALPLFLPVLTLGELACGLLNVAGIVMRFYHTTWYLSCGFAATGVVLLMLLFGQRVSKEYAGAASLTGYFIIALIGLLVSGL